MAGQGSPAVTGLSLFQRRNHFSLTQALVGTVMVLLVLTLYLPSTPDFGFLTASAKDQSGKQQQQYLDGTDATETTADDKAVIKSPGIVVVDDEPLVSFSNEDILQDLSHQKITGSDTGVEFTALCSKGDRRWNPNIVIECPVLAGGFGNIRLNLLTCLRYVIEARVSMKLPTIRRRNAHDISDFATSDQVSLSYLIDEQHLLRTLEQHCPGLVIHPSDYGTNTNTNPNTNNNAANLRNLGVIHPVLDMHLDADLPDGTPPDFSVPTFPQQWPPALDAWLDSVTNGTRPSADSPVLFAIRQIMFAWPTSYDPPSLVRLFGELVRPRDEVRILAASALLQMQERFATHIGFRDSREPFVHEDAFVGVHLRVEKDASDYNYLSYDQQVDYLTQRLLPQRQPQGKNNNNNNHNPPVSSSSSPHSAVLDLDLPNTTPGKTVLYVACGDAAGVARLAHDVAPITVVTKTDLLPEGTFAGTALRNMTWDQQAIVDLLVLEHAGYFIGMRDSTFSWYLALRRAAAVNWVTGGYPETCWLENEGGGPRRRSGCKALLAHNEEWRDDLSAIVGNGHVRVEPLVSTTWP